MSFFRYVFARPAAPRGGLSSTGLSARLLGPSVTVLACTRVYRVYKPWHANPVISPVNLGPQCMDAHTVRDVRVA